MEHMQFLICFPIINSRKKIIQNNELYRRYLPSQLIESLQAQDAGEYTRVHQHQ